MNKKPLGLARRKRFRADKQIQGVKNFESLGFINNLDNIDLFNMSEQNLEF